MEKQKLKETIKTYDTRTSRYISNTVSKVTGEHKDYINSFLKLITKDSSILEVGSGSGRDADYIESLGYHVIRTDFATGFIEYQKSLGKNIVKFDVINGTLKKEFDLIIARAVFLHFTNKQFKKALLNTKKHLKPNGYFAMTLKVGKGEEFSSHKMGSPRYFNYWEEDELLPIFKETKFEVTNSYLAMDGKWLHLVLRSIQN